MTADTTTYTENGPAVAYRHIQVSDCGEVTYVGYSLPLSPMEVSILRCLIAHATNAPHNDPPYLDKTSLLAALSEPDDAPSAHAADARMTDGQLSVHIGRINRKAQAIGGRDLIQCKRYHGYRLNPFM